jgi:hypothetical protein
MPATLKSLICLAVLGLLLGGCSKCGGFLVPNACHSEAPAR